jgi:predicted NAD/FAD-dependent oxidoreductase
MDGLIMREFVILGTGPTGMSVALRLQELGLTIFLVVDQAGIGWGARRLVRR